MVFSLILDILGILIVVLCAIKYYKKGFFSGLVKLVGGVLSIVFSGLLSSYVANWLFENFYRVKLEEVATQTIEEQASGGLSIVDQILNYLPSQLSSGLKEALEQQTQEVASAYSENIVTSVIGPLVTPVIQASVFAVFLCLFLFLFNMLSKLFVGMNTIPLVGGVNQILGAVVGVFLGLLAVYIILCILWVVSVMLDGSTFSTTILPQSYMYKLFEPFNILAKMFETT